MLPSRWSGPPGRGPSRPAPQLRRGPWGSDRGTGIRVSAWVVGGGGGGGGFGCTATLELFAEVESRRGKPAREFPAMMRHGCEAIPGESSSSVDGVMPVGAPGRRSMPSPPSPPRFPPNGSDTSGGSRLCGAREWSTLDGEWMVCGLPHGHYGQHDAGLMSWPNLAEV